MPTRQYRRHQDLSAHRGRGKDHAQVRILRRHVQHRLLRWQQSVNQADRRGISALLAEDSALVLPEGRMVRGRRKIARFLAVVRPPGGQLRLQIDELNVGRTIGVANGRAAVTVVNPDGQRVQLSAGFSVSWARPSGVLALILHSFGPTTESARGEHSQQAGPFPDRRRGPRMT